MPKYFISFLLIKQLIRFKLISGFILTSTIISFFKLLTSLHDNKLIFVK
jgi:hypothetical protein